MLLKDKLNTYSIQKKDLDVDVILPISQKVVIAIIVTVAGLLPWQQCAS